MTVSAYKNVPVKNSSVSSVITENVTQFWQGRWMQKKESIAGAIESVIRVRALVILIAAYVECDTFDAWLQSHTIDLQKGNLGPPLNADLFSSLSSLARFVIGNEHLRFKVPDLDSYDENKKHQDVVFFKGSAPEEPLLSLSSLYEFDPSDCAAITMKTTMIVNVESDVPIAVDSLEKGSDEVTRRADNLRWKSDVKPTKKMWLIYETTFGAPLSAGAGSGKGDFSHPMREEDQIFHDAD